MKHINRLIVLCILTAGILVFSPIAALFLNGRFIDHVYNRLAYQVIAGNLIKNCTNESQKVRRIFSYVVNHEFAQGIPFKCKPLDTLISAEGYCDFQARTLNSLLSACGVKSRYAMLLDNSGISRHTLNEVFIGGKWAVYDPLMNIEFYDEDGNYFTLEELSNKPDYLYSTKRITEVKRIYNEEAYNYCISYYFRLFPMPYPPKRSTPLIEQKNIFDIVTDSYYRLLGRPFFDAYQDAYLGLKIKRELRGRPYGLFYAARNYHLAGRHQKALENYNRLAEGSSEFKDDAIFFKGMLYFETGRARQAIETLREVLADSGSNRQAAALFYTGLCYDALGQTQEAVKCYKQSSFEKIPPFNVNTDK